VPPDVGPFYVGHPRQSRPWETSASTNRPKENRVSSTFLPGLSAANSAKESEIEIHTEPTASNTAISLGIASPRAPAASRLSSHGVRHWQQRVGTPCHRAVSQMCQRDQQFSCVIVGPSAGDCIVDAVTMSRRQSQRCPSESVKPRSPAEACVLVDQYKHMLIRNFPRPDDIARSLSIAPPVIEYPHQPPFVRFLLKDTAQS
jgi:hypothetical protein